MRNKKLTPLVIAGLLLLTSCSQDSQSANCGHKQGLYKFHTSMIENQNARVAIFKDFESAEAEETLKEIYSLRYKMATTLMVLTIDYPKCFSVEQISEARRLLVATE